ncbi:MerR [Pseudonocardia sp. TRM90224]|uniref:MerR n=1 Tax=Pseudonocardia sp. TRM90224 TaxID=2812678 RepID=UPI001E5F070E|nr:MerR [Pseudonocardia sp. TRM90224]
MSKRPTYGVTVGREDGLWTAEVDGLPPNFAAATDVEHFADLDREVRDLIAGLMETEPDEFDLVWHYIQGDQDYTSRLEQFRMWEDRLRVDVEHHEAARKAAIEAMRAAGLSLRDIADVVQISYQRVHQIAG